MFRALERPWRRGGSALDLLRVGIELAPPVVDAYVECLRRWTEGEGRAADAVRLCDSGDGARLCAAAGTVPAARCVIVPVNLPDRWILFALDADGDDRCIRIADPADDAALDVPTGILRVRNPTRRSGPAPAAGDRVRRINARSPDGGSAPRGVRDGLQLLQNMEVWARAPATADLRGSGAPSLGRRRRLRLVQLLERLSRTGADPADVDPAERYPLTAPDGGDSERRGPPPARADPVPSRGAPSRRGAVGP